MKKICQSITIENMKLLKRIGIWFDRHPTATDGIVALALAGLAFLNLYINWGTESTVRAVLAIVLTLIIILPLTLRRHYPLAVLIVMTVAILSYRSLNIPESSFTFYALLLAFFSVGAYGDRRWRGWVRGLTALAIIGYLTYSVFFIERSWIFPVKTLLSQVSVILSDAFLFGAAWWIGDVFRIRRERELELQERTVQLEHERDENARRAVLDERVRIARELHDVVAHHVSVMGIQAGAARRILKQQPEKANEVLSQIETSSRQAVDELQRLLGFLRQQNQVDELTPQPSLKQLEMLVNHMYEAGLPVEIRIEGDLQPLPPGVDLSAYRIVQEALTNTLKHAGPARASVTIRYVTNAIELEIRDDGRGTTQIENLESHGRGLIGMRERVTLHGGEFTARNAPGTGFVVRAKLPLSGRVL
jgi:signal transduction histidine kinase